MNGCIKNKLYQFTERKKKIVIWNCPCERRTKNDNNNDDNTYFNKQRTQKG